MSDNFYYTVNPNLVKADIGTMSLAYLPGKQTFLVMNKTAGMLLSILEVGKSKANLLKALDILYPKIESRIKTRHVEAFIHLALDNNVAEKSEKPPGTITKSDLPDNNAELEAPIITPYEKKWILQHHPEAVYEPKFSDIWSPATGGV